MVTRFLAHPNHARGLAAYMRAIALALALACALILAGCGATGVGAASSGSTAGSAASSNANALADGTYTVDVVLEGGSGRAGVASPAVLEVDGGALTATITWSSSHYDKMTVDGTDYQPVSAPGENAQFSIPVSALDEDIPVQAETTAMSQPHTIDYTLSFDSASLTAKDAGDDAGPTSGSAAGSTQVVANFHNTDLGCGWQPTGSMELEAAKGFTVDYFGSFKLICICDGERYLVVPEGESAPDNLAGDISVIRQPLRNVYLAASDAGCLLDALGALDSIALSGIARDNWSVQGIVDAMDSGAIQYAGKYNTPDYERIVAAQSPVAIESTMINHSPDVKRKLQDLGVTVLTEMSSYETDPLGRTEWVKLYGVLFNEEDVANQLFQTQAATVQEIQKQVSAADEAQAPTVAFFYVNDNGAAVVRRQGDYVSSMIELAGGKNILARRLDDSATTALRGAATGSTTMDMETFYTVAKDADVIVYNGSIDGGVSSIDDLVAKNPLLADFSAVKAGNVWTSSTDLYQHMTDTGTVVADLHTALTGTGQQTTYLHKLQ